MYTHELNYNSRRSSSRQSNNNIQVVFKNCAPLCSIDNDKDIDVVMPMYTLIDYSNNYSKTSGSLWQY